MNLRINQANDNYDRKTEQYIVAFIDVLGVTKRILSSDQNDSLNLMHNLYTFFTETTKQIAFHENKELQFKIFSDNIIIAKKLSDNTLQRIKDIKCLLNAASHFQIDAVGESVGYLVRGGITIGDLFIDNTMVYGKALVDAYGLESKVAVFPRIAIDKKTALEISGYCELRDYVMKDFDDVYFLNYLSIWQYCGDILQRGFQKIKKEASNKIDERILQKLNWHKNYVNTQLKNKGEDYYLVTDI